MDPSFKAGKIFQLGPVWNNSLELLRTFGVETPPFVKRMINERALNLFDVDLFRRNQQVWKFNGTRYNSEKELLKALWLNYSGARVYAQEFKDRLFLLLAWGAIIKVQEKDLQDPDLVINPVNYILDSEKMVDGKLCKKFRMILQGVIICFCIAKETFSHFE